MDGIHDLGGMHGFGAIPDVDREEPWRVFHAPWEGRVFGLVSLTLGRGFANADRFRFGIECLPPADYLSAGYYGRWLGSIVGILEERGVLAAGELAARVADPASPARDLPADALPVPPSLRTSLRDAAQAPRFSVGERVRVVRRHPPGHTRMPRYVRGRVGRIVLVHPSFVYPDTNAHGRGEHPQHVYGVRFEGRELWGADAEAATAVHVDLFEDYLQREAA